ncbi:hypothetical protein PR202_ga24027 [Eleusine coracana subsp. coracana]|uniref:VQ domain-containing protein n=1 Tax=Eleusine coracana subsp. coracana TaxID=191504 RepID=A0AAV5D8D7_ELECO|nr:hypothetical protein PR202_ga24027 [Eleusine coracana subsp. coracana]
MANPCAGLDPTWAHLPAPAAGHCHSWLFPAAAFENEALTSALRASMSPAIANSSPSSSASDLLSGGCHDAPAPASRPFVVLPPARGAGPKPAGRVAKRKPRPSRRPPPTYIVADPANFRRMVQEVTGFPVACLHEAAALQPASSTEPTSWTTPPPACMLPTLDTSAFLLDREVATPARVAEDKTSSESASPSMAVTAPAAVVVEDDRDSSVFQELEAIACAPAFLADDFPTLESWGII